MLAASRVIRETIPRGRGTAKTPVIAAVERGGKIRRRVIASVTGETLKEAIRQEVTNRLALLSDDFFRL